MRDSKYNGFQMEKLSMNPIMSLVASLMILGIAPSWGELAAPVEVSGRVHFSDDGTPAEGARIIFFDLADLSNSFSSTTDAEGNFTLFLRSSSASAPVVPQTFRLLQNFPNPFNPSTLIPYDLQHSTHVRLEVFNLLGQRVRTLVDEVQTAGSYTATWDAKDEGGAGIAAGIYLYRLTAGGVSDSRQMVLVDGPVSGAASSGGFPSSQGFSARSALLPSPQVYGITISGRGIVIYVQPDLLVATGMDPLSFGVDRVVAGASTKVVADASSILGDVNNDGRVNISDALIVATYGNDHSITLPNNGDISLGDVNKDGRVNISDALIIASYGNDPTNSNLPAGIGQPVGVVISEAAVMVGNEGSPFTFSAISGDQVTFAVEDQAPPIEEGDVLVNTVEPYFLKKVTRVVRQSPGEVVVETRPAALTEVVEKGTIRERFSLSEGAPKVAAPGAVQVEVIDFDETAHISSDVSVRVHGAVDFDPEYEFVIDIDEGRLEEFRLVAEGEVRADIGFELKAATGYEGLREWTVAQVPTPPFIKVFFIGLVPVVVTLQSEFSIGAAVNAEVAATLTSGASLSKEVQLGVEYVNDGWQQVRGADPHWETSGSTSVSVNGAASLRAFVLAQVHLKLYDVAGPQVGLEPFVELGVVSQNLQEAICTVDAGVDARFGVEVALLDRELASWSRSFNWGMTRLKERSIVLENEAPVAAISAPTVRTFTEGTVITFRGSGTDLEDGTLPGSALEWRSSRDGFIGQGSTVSTLALSAGTHTITLQAEDSGGARDSAAITLTVEPVVKRPDLQVDNLVVEPPLKDENTPLTVSVRVANVGEGAANSVLVVLRADGVEKDRITLDLDANMEAEIEFDPFILSAGSPTLEVVADPNGLLDEANTANNRVDRTLSVSSAWAAARSLVFILDLSGSMDEPLPGESQKKIEAAKEALEQVLANAVSDGSQEYALVTFGAVGCDVGVDIPFTTSPGEIVGHTRGVTTGGSTPLAQALAVAQHLALDQASSDDVQLVLLSDGQHSSSCGGDPKAVAEAIAAGRRAPLVAAKILARVVKLNVIGFGLEPGGAAETEVREIADIAGGEYFRVSQVEDLVGTLGQASGLRSQDIPTLSGRVINHLGDPIQGASVWLHNHPDIREQTDADGKYKFPISFDFQGSDSLIVEVSGYERIALEVLLFGADRDRNIQLSLSAELLPVAVARAEPSSVELGGQVTLRGAESSDPAGGRLIFHWSQLLINPFPVSFSSNDSEAAFAVRATLEDLGTYHFVLVVENELGLESEPDTVSVEVRRPIVTEIFSLSGGATMEFVWIEPGTFTMGSPSSEPGRDSDEGPQHEVTISQGFYLGKFEITQAQWESVMGNNPSAFDGSNRPVEQVSWNDLQAFIQRLNEAAGEALYRLPTEAEWEYTARAGTTTRWSFGDDESQLGDYAWYSGNNSPSGTKEVGTKLPNPWGLYDMHGNVWEWVQDWIGSYTSGSQIDPTGPSPGSVRVVRGGGFGSFARSVRSASRRGDAPGSRGDFHGARLLRTK
jgi:formylglycine-generating enzyme required for sulfatase activity/Mg-chelatase subunit ChlD